MLIRGKMRSEVVAPWPVPQFCWSRARSGPVEVEGAFASPAIIALASLFVIAYAMELSGLLGLMIRHAVRAVRAAGRGGILDRDRAVAASRPPFVNNTPIVVLTAPVIRDVSQSLSLSAKRFLIPLSYATILGGACTLIGTSTNLLVNDMARNAGQPVFSLFEITPVALWSRPWRAGFICWSSAVAC